ncbi:hypothetical protein D3C85_1751200 [compost metagenome]
MGFFRDRTGDFTAGLLILAGINLSAVAIVLFINRTRTKHVPTAQPETSLS